MNFTSAQKQELRNGIENCYQSHELTETFKERYHNIYQAMAKDVLEQNGYPKNADIEKGDIDVKLSPKSSYDSYIELIERDELIENQEDYNTKVKSQRFYTDVILSNIRDIQIEFILKDDPIAYLEKNPTEEYLSTEMEKRFSSSKLIEHLKEDQDFQNEYVEEKAVEEGIDDNVDISQIRYEITEAKVIESYDVLAELVLDNGYFDSGKTVSAFLSQEFYQFIVNNHLYEAKVEIQTDPEELQEM